MINYEDYFGGLTEEEYIKETEEHFKWIKENSKNDSKEVITMYNKKYRLTKIMTEIFNPIHEGLENTVCYLAYLNEGERGWFLYQPNSWFDRADRIHTSVIKEVEYKDNKVVVTTQNTVYVFELINE